MWSLGIFMNLATGKARHFVQKFRSEQEALDAKPEMS